MNLHKEAWRFPALLLLTVLANIGMGIVMPVLPIYFKQYDVSVAALSVPYATLVLGRLCSRAFSPAAIMRWGHRRAVMAAFLLYALVFAAYLGAGSLAQFGMLRFIEGLVEGVLAIALNDLAIGYVRGVDSQQRVRLMGRFGSAFGLGFLLGPLAGAAIAHWLGLQAIFVAGALVGLLAMLLAGVALAPVAARAGHAGPRPALGMLLALYSPQSLRRVLFFSLMILLPLHVTGALGMEASRVGMFFAASAVLTTLLMPLAGHVSQRIGQTALIDGGLWFMGAALLLMGLVQAPLGFAALFVLETVAFALMLPPAMALFSTAVEDHPERARVMGSMAFATELLSLPPAFLLPALYAYRPVLGWAAVAVLCLATLWAGRRARHHLAPAFSAAHLTREERI